MKRSRSGWISSAIVIVAMVLLLTPLIAAAAVGFTAVGEGLSLTPVLEAVSSRSFLPQVLVSLLLAVLSTVVALALLLPTLLLLHLRLPWLLPIAEALTLVAYVVPPVALVSGVNITFRAVAPSFITSVYSLIPFYVVLSMPLVYRALDAGMRSIDVTTLFSAGRSLGASVPRTIVQILMPNLTSAVVSAALLCATLSLGEFVFASLLLHQTYPVFLAELGALSVRPAAAMAFLTLCATWLLMVGLTRFSEHLDPLRRRSGGSRDTRVAAVAQTHPQPTKAKIS